VRLALAFLRHLVAVSCTIGTPREGPVISDSFVQNPRPVIDGAEEQPPAGSSLAGRTRWRPPNGRDLLAGVAVLAVLYAVLIVFTSDAAPPPRGGDAEALPRPVAPDPRPAPVDWSDVPVATRVTELGPALARPVADGLASVREKLARCVALDRRRRQAAPAPEVTTSASAELVLSLVAHAGAVQVEAVEVRSPGASPGLVGCARRLLAGEAFPAPGAVPGRRYRLAHVLE
jgi:hypothetical protein